MHLKNQKKAQDLAVEFDRAQANAIRRLGQLMDELSDVRCEVQVSRALFRQEMSKIGITFEDRG